MNGKDGQPHSQPLSWQGWKVHDFALEMQEPWAQHLLHGRKTIETRAYNLPPALLGRKIWILQSTAGQAGVSALGNTVPVGNDSSSSFDARIVGWCTFSTVKEYTSASQFRADESKHLVKSNSGYDWKENQALFGWMVESCEKHATPGHGEDGGLAIRRFRSLFQLDYETKSDALSPKRTSRMVKKNAKGERKKKKRRF